MKIKYTIEKIEKQDLVNLFSTALYGSDWLCSDYDEEAYQEITDICDCYEDKLAAIILTGGKIMLRDYYAEDSTDKYGTVINDITWDEDCCCMNYNITLEDVKRGLQKAFEDCAHSSKCMLDLINDDACNLDQPEAETLMQYIMFGEMIYG